MRATEFLKLSGMALLAALIAMCSLAVQRLGPDHGIYCALGKSVEGYDIYCPRPKLNAGWPAPFLFDKLGISVEGALFPIEDDFRRGPFVANLAFYLLVLSAARSAAAAARRRRHG